MKLGRILLVSPREVKGGGIQVERAILEAGREIGYRFTIVALSRGYSQNDYTADLFTVSPSTWSSIGITKKLGSYLAYVSLQRKYLRAITCAHVSLKPQAILYNGGKLPLASRIAETIDTPSIFYVLSHFDVNPFEGRELLKRLHESLYPAIYSSTASRILKSARRLKVLTISEYERSWLRGTYGIESHVVYPPIDQSFTPGGRKSDFILTVGVYAPFKQHDMAVRVLSKTKGRTRLVIAGFVDSQESERYHAWLNRYVKSLGLEERVKLLTNVSREQLLSLYRQAACFLFPIGLSGGFPCTLGLVMVEALACGTPVVAPAKGGPCEIVLNGVNGFLVSDESEMAAHIDEILSNHALRSELSKNAPPSVEKFRLEPFKEELRRAIGEVS